MAVTKSANATFHAPPWWACPPFLTRLMMMGFAASMTCHSDGLRIWFMVDGQKPLFAFFLNMRFQFDKAWTFGGKQGFPSELHSYLGVNDAE